MTGRWARYWSTTGRADTECYVFDANGDFRWRNAKSVPGGVTHRSGKWVTSEGGLALTVEAQRDGGGPATPVRERLALTLGACPDNPEALALDASYACISIDGKAFFRQPRPAPGQSQARTRAGHSAENASK